MAIAPQQEATAVRTNMSVKAKIISQNSDFGAPREWLNGNAVDTVRFEQERGFTSIYPAAGFSTIDSCLFGLSVTLSSIEMKHSTKKLVYCRLEY